MDAWPADTPKFLSGTRRNLECLTRDQSSHCWLEMRKGRITSTKVASVCQGKNWNKTREEIRNPRDILHMSFVARGKEDEQKSVDYLLHTLRSQGAHAEAYSIGLVIHPEYEFITASSDRLMRVNEEWCLAEIKNWYLTAKQQSLADIRYLDKNRSLKKSHSHYYQIQTALMVSGMRRCYFVVHGKDSTIEAIEYDEAFCKRILETTKTFYETMLKPLGW